MKELTLARLIAARGGMCGRSLVWVMAGAAALITPLHLYVPIRDRRVSWRKCLPARLAMPFGAVGALLLVWNVTGSGLRDVGGPADVIALAAVAAAGAVGAAVPVCTRQSLVRRPGAASTVK